MHIISMLLLPGLFLLFGVESVPTFVHQDAAGNTLICNKCQPGTYMVAYCTATTPTKCEPCKSQHFTELWNYLPKCLYCYNFCTENQEVETECSATTNRVCRCKEGFYMTGDFCMRHAECGPGHGVKTKGTPQTNTVCESCSDGYFSASSSALESCVKHQECASGQIALLPGSVTHDKMCGSCEDLANGGETLRAFVSGFFSMHRMRVAKMKTFVSTYIHKSGAGTLPKHRGPLMDQIRAWIAQAPDEQLKKLPQMLKESQLCSMTEKLGKIVGDIQQQSPNCTSPFVV
ncbi:tumor necrosis factor receptor superfamily member 6B-like [Plectropomus leopardus]|uniref:tumor necrosis factor receptor superfamily member 6B-like n=1 Tax=Plectropomus leopardus TaxID=160734 RepID=UPI001C4B4521|nr:tumor necrosis factor receptor superfamily member 6B-like [Plectropomus leopardus]